MYIKRRRRKILQNKKGEIKENFFTPFRPTKLQKRFTFTSLSLCQAFLNGSKHDYMRTGWQQAIVSFKQESWKIENDEKHFSTITFSSCNDWVSLVWHFESTASTAFNSFERISLDHRNFTISTPVAPVLTRNLF